MPSSESASNISQILDTALDAQMGLDVDHMPIAGSRRPVDDRGYWSSRKNDRIYLMTVLFSHFFCRRKRSVADVGCHCSPLVLMLPGFERRYAIDPSDISKPLWSGVDGAEYINDYLRNVDIALLTGGDDKFDLIICNQVIEHLHEPASFASELCERARRLIVSTTFETPAGLIEGHVQDPISLEKFESWFPRKMLCCFISSGVASRKILAVF